MTSIQVRGNGFAYEAPRGWAVSRPAQAVVAKGDGGLVSVTRFPLAKAYDPASFDIAAKSLDRVAKRLDARAKGETIEVDGQKARSYTYGSKRIGFVLVGKTEFQLFCQTVGSACDLLFGSFRLTGPSA